MSLLSLLLACGGGASAPPEAPKIDLEDHMLTCMGDGDCASVVTACCPGTAMAVNKANAEMVEQKAIGKDECANVTCPEIGVPAVKCKAMKCVLEP